MPSIRQLFVCLLFLNANGFFVFRDGFVTALSDSPFEVGKDILKDVFDWKLKNLEDFAKLEPPKHEPTCFKSSKLKDTSTRLIKSFIEITTEKNKFKKPLTFFTSLDETSQVNATGKSLKVAILNPVTVATLTGGVLGNDLFELYEYSFAWEESSCNTTLQSQVIYRNLKYDSFEKALDYPDGIAIVVFPIATSGDFPNPKFNQFSSFLQTQMKAPSSKGCSTIKSAFTYTWFVNFPLGSIYHTYRMLYWDAKTGKTTKAFVIEMPLDQRVNYISQKQFQVSFSKMSPSSGQLLQSNDELTPVERGEGIVVLYLPA